MRILLRLGEVRLGVIILLSCQCAEICHNKCMFTGCINYVERKVFLGFSEMSLIMM